MLITYYVGNILELFSNQTLILQNMVITLNFINTATITHGDAKLHINYFDLLMYFLQVIITINFLCIQIWNCINTKNFGKLHEKLNIRQFLYADKTDIYLQFMSNYMTWSVYLGSICDSPGRIKVTGHLVNDNVTYVKDVCLTI